MLSGASCFRFFLISTFSCTELTDSPASVFFLSTCSTANRLDEPNTTNNNVKYKILLINIPSTSLIKMIL
ncbi:hypothetical protein WCLE_011020 [Wolbachia endosymbiont of Cimex lectularius]|nr:hypothetical protein WCLE_011020 [Wolbachia endosymbiont of Cimex lectularius]